MIGLFFCSKAIACAEGDAAAAAQRAALLKLPIGTVVSGPPGGITTVGPNATLIWKSYAPVCPGQRFEPPAPRFYQSVAPIVKDTPVIPIGMQAENLRNAFEKISKDCNEATRSVLRQSLEAQLAKILCEYCKVRQKDISAIVSEEIPDKGSVGNKVRDIAIDEFKKAVNSLSPSVRIQLSKLQKLKNPMDTNSFNPSGWQSNLVSTKYIGNILDKLSADQNNRANIEAVTIYVLLRAEVFNSEIANLSATPAEDVNSITKAD
jgi:hypothetical protein